MNISTNLGIKMKNKYEYLITITIKGMETEQQLDVF